MDKILLEMRKSGQAAFKTREYAALLGKPGYARLVLHRLKVKGELVLVKKGFYAFADADPRAVACELSKPCYLSFFSALHLHGLTTQIPNKAQLAVLRNAKSYSVLGSEVQEYKIARESFSGFKFTDGLPLASKEKAFADCLNAPRSCPRVILAEALGEVDASVVLKFCSISGKKRLAELMKSARQD